MVLCSFITCLGKYAVLSVIIAVFKQDQLLTSILPKMNENGNRKLTVVFVKL